MTHFTKEQLQELETRYGLKPVADVRPVRDGMVHKESKVWWRGVDGPEEVTAGDGHWSNILAFPEAYSVEKPRYRVTYTDDGA